MQNALIGGSRMKKAFKILSGALLVATLSIGIYTFTNTTKEDAASSTVSPLAIKDPGGGGH